MEETQPGGYLSSCDVVGRVERIEHPDGRNLHYPTFSEPVVSAVDNCVREISP